MSTHKTCLHCQLPLDPSHTIGEGFCCHGCETVYQLLNQEGLNRFYDLSDGQKPPVQVRTDGDYGWVEEKVDSGCLDVSINGIHCSACVWLLEEVFERQEGGQEILINPTMGSVTLRYDPQRFNPVDYFTQMESLGYQATPRKKELPRVSQTLLWRVGVSVALTMNVMLMYISFYMGLTPESELYQPFWMVSSVLTLINVIVGGWPFFKTSIGVLRKGMLHLDLPIAAGIISSSLSNVVLMLHTGGQEMYLDSLNSFITLMLLGRFFQTRSIENNRQQLQQHEEDVDWRMVRILSTEEEIQQERISVQQIETGDRLMIPVGGVIPVPSTLFTTKDVQLNLAWITGESDLIPFTSGSPLPAGALNATAYPIEVVTTDTWEHSTLKQLLTIPPSSEHQDIPRWFQPILRWYVPLVFTISGLGFLWWYSAGIDRALAVTTALLIVTCPCAFGIALPLAKELAVLHLKAQGIFVRTTKFFAQATGVKRVVFDKTGTLTMGDIAAIQTGHLSELDRKILYNMVSRSHHPKSRAIFEMLEHQGAPQWIDDFALTEEGGVGLRYQGYHLEKHPKGDTQFRQGTTVLATFHFQEKLRGNLQVIVSQLNQQRIEVSILSGDTPTKVQQLLAQIDLPDISFQGGLSPEDKANWILAHQPQQTMMVGDGLNDAPAFDVSGISVTPANALGGLLSRADVYLTGDNLRSVWQAIHGARYTEQTQKHVFTFALVYNVIVITIAFFGEMSPLMAAVLMPLSSIGLVSYTLWRQRNMLRQV